MLFTLHLITHLQGEMLAAVIGAAEPRSSGAAEVAQSGSSAAAAEPPEGQSRQRDGSSGGSAAERLPPSLGKRLLPGQAAPQGFVLAEPIPTSSCDSQTTEEPHGFTRPGVRCDLEEQDQADDEQALLQVWRGWLGGEGWRRAGGGAVTLRFRLRYAECGPRLRAAPATEEDPEQHERVEEGAGAEAAALSSPAKSSSSSTSHIYAVERFTSAKPRLDARSAADDAPVGGSTATASHGAPEIPTRLYCVQPLLALPEHMQLDEHCGLPELPCLLRPADAAERQLQRPPFEHALSVRLRLSRPLPERIPLRIRYLDDGGNDAVSAAGAPPVRLRDMMLPLLPPQAGGGGGSGGGGVGEFELWRARLFGALWEEASSKTAGFEGRDDSRWPQSFKLLECAEARAHAWLNAQPCCIDSGEEHTRIPQPRVCGFLKHCSLCCSPCSLAASTAQRAPLCGRYI